MNILKYRLNELFIILLILLAMYQTTILWFGDIYSDILFYNNKNNLFNNIESDSYILESFFINTGDNNFIRKYNNISNADYKHICDDIIEEAITKSGSYSYHYDKNNILNNFCIIYQYDFYINIRDMNSIFNMSSNSKIERLEKYNLIIITPTQNDSSSNIKVDFVDSETLEAFEVVISNYDLNQEASEAINQLSFMGKNDYIFKSSLDLIDSAYINSNFITNLNNKNLFIPTPTKSQEYFLLNTISAKNPLEIAGSILLTESEKYVDMFFEVPATKTTSSINDIYTYSDENVVVKYYTNGILEYVNYKTQPSNNKKPYEIAVEFLNRDTKIQNEFYLVDYNINQENNSYSFYFDYKLNGFPITLEQNLKQDLNMSSIIEIEVKNGVVSRYRRLIYDFYIESDYIIVKDSQNYSSYFNFVIETALNTAKSISVEDVEESSINDLNIQDIKISYIFKGINTPITPIWNFKVNSNYYKFDI
ncbi:MAG: hypothetical protein R3Y29_04685 [bacterium]